MHPRMAELFGYIDEQHEMLRSMYDGIPEEQRGARPAPGTWSPAEVIGHLTLIERRLAGLFTMKLEAARAAGLAAESDTAPLLPTMNLAPVLDRTTRITAPDTADPIKRPDSPATWEEYEQARAQLKSAALAGDGLALSEISHPHPIFGPLNLYTWLAFCGAHAARHTAQIRETVAQLPAS